MVPSSQSMDHVWVTLSSSNNLRWHVRMLKHLRIQWNVMICAFLFSSWKNREKSVGFSEIP